MRIALITAAAACALLPGCGGNDAGQADDSAAGIGAAERPATTQASMVAAINLSPVGKAQAQKIMHDRHEGMEAIGKANKAIRRELDGASPDLAVVRQNAGKLGSLAQQSAGWFRAGTGPDAGKTGAKPAIWQNQRDFAAKQAAFGRAVEAFGKAAAGKDVAATKASFGELGKSCKGCHESYRKEMKH